MSIRILAIVVLPIVYPAGTNKEVSEEALICRYSLVSKETLLCRSSLVSKEASDEYLVRYMRF